MGTFALGVCDTPLRISQWINERQGQGRAIAPTDLHNGQMKDKGKAEPLPLQGNALPFLDASGLGREIHAYFV
jgi:hypothetical protein